MFFKTKREAYRHKRQGPFPDLHAVVKTTRTIIHWDRLDSDDWKHVESGYTVVMKPSDKMF